MPMNISASSFFTCVSGCSLPSSFFLPGMVTSMTSSASFLSSIAAKIADFRSSISFASFWRISFAKAPILGRSSALSLPMPFNTAVSSPFLPIYVIRISSSDSIASAFLSAASTDALICSSFSFILFSLSLINLKSSVPNKIWDEA